MGAFKCQFGVTHRMCRCPKEHNITCDKPSEHKPVYKQEDLNLDEPVAVSELDKLLGLTCKHNCEINAVTTRPQATHYLDCPVWTHLLGGNK